MKYPRLIPKSFQKTPIKIILYSDEISEEGEVIKSLEINTLCNYQNNAKRILDSEHRLIQIEGRVLIDGDIAPNLTNISDGEVEVYGNKFRIYKGRKNRNPDGSVNYTSLELV